MPTNCAYCGHPLYGNEPFCPRCKANLQPQPQQQPVPLPGMMLLRVTWPGVFIAMHEPIELYVNDIYMGNFPFKRPFDVTIEVPVNSVLKVKFAVLWFPCKIKVQGNPGDSFLCRLDYSRFSQDMSWSLERIDSLGKGY